MEPVSSNERLNFLTTRPTLVQAALHGADDARRVAQDELVARYGGAIRRYLQASVRDSEAVDELFQEFALRLCRGGLDGFDATRGRFRDFLKGVLRNLIVHHLGRKQRRPDPLPEDPASPGGGPPSLLDEERVFLASWRDELLARTWAALERHEQQSGQPFYTVLRFRADHPDTPSAAMAETLTGRLGRPLTAAWVRQTLRRARDRFAQILLEEVADSLESPTRDRLEQELSQLGLLDYCRDALPPNTNPSS